jgi:hypothetical protein
VAVEKKHVFDGRLGLTHSVPISTAKDCRHTETDEQLAREERGFNGPHAEANVDQVVAEDAVPPSLFERI